jgi:hypothetical protein
MVACFGIADTSHAKKESHSLKYSQFGKYKIMCGFGSTVVSCGVRDKMKDGCRKRRLMDQ